MVRGGLKLFLKMGLKELSRHAMHWFQPAASAVICTCCTHILTYLDSGAKRDFKLSFSKVPIPRDLK